MRTWQSKCAAWRKRANLRKNHRFGNVNTQVCVLTRAKLDLLRCSAQPVAQTALRWWQQTRLLSKTAFVLATTNRAIARMLSNQARERVVVAIPHDRLLGEACCARKTDDISVAISLAWWRAVRHVAFPIVLAMSTHKCVY